MAAVDLLFARAPVPSPGPVALVFGDAGGEAPPGAVTVSAAWQISGLHGAVRVLTVPVVQVVGRITGLRGSAQVVQGAWVQVLGQVSGLRGRVELVQGVRVAVFGRLSGLRGRAAARYDVNVQRPTVGRTAAGWQDAQQRQAGVRSAYQQTALRNVGTRSHWQDAEAVASSLRAMWQDTERLHRAVCSLFEQAERLPAAPTRSNFQEAQRLRNDIGARFQEALRLPVVPLRVQFEEAIRLRSGSAAHFQVADRLVRHITSGMGVAVPLQRTWGGRYQEAWPPRPGQWQRPGPPVPEPCYVPALPARLVFADPHDASLPARLVFICERAQPPGPQPGGETVVVPIRRVYVTINSIILARVSDGMLLPADGFGMSIDTDSWTWQWSASMQPHLRQYLAPVDGEPVQVEAVINGVPYRLCAESISSDRSFGRARIAVRGRGLGAVLDAPYAPTRNFGNATDLTAQQLMQAALTVNGVGIGWDVDFGLTDWLVPAGAWSHQGHYMSAITAIAQAAGGYVQPHATLQTLRILPRYPHKPWEWGALAPDFELPADVVSVEGIEWTTRPAYNRVHVSGVAQGVLAEATRAGTAGSLVAPMVTDPLITHADAARQRALAVLADTGAQASVTLTLPVLAETGLILPGKFVRYSDGPVQRTGIVRASSVNWSRPTLRQTLQLETHGSD